MQNFSKFFHSLVVIAGGHLDQTNYGENQPGETVRGILNEKRKKDSLHFNSFLDSLSRQPHWNYNRRHE